MTENIPRMAFLAAAKILADLPAFVPPPRMHMHNGFLVLNWPGTGADSLCIQSDGQVLEGSGTRNKVLVRVEAHWSRQPVDIDVWVSPTGLWDKGQETLNAWKVPATNTKRMRLTSYPEAPAEAAAPVEGTTP